MHYLILQTRANTCNKHTANNSGFLHKIQPGTSHALSNTQTQ